MQVPSTDGFVHIRLNPDLGDDLDAVKAQLSSSNARIVDPADYELTTLQRLPPDTAGRRSAPGRDGLGAGLFGAGTARGTSLRLGITFRAQSSSETCCPGIMWLPFARLSPKRRWRKCSWRLGEAEPRATSRFAWSRWWSWQQRANHRRRNAIPGPIGSRRATLTPSPDDIDHYGAKILVRNHSDRPRYVAAFLIDPAFVTHRLTFAAYGKLAHVAPAASAEVPAPFQPDSADWLKGRYRLVTIWSDEAFDPDALPATIAPPTFSTSFAEYRDVEPSIGALGGAPRRFPEWRPSSPNSTLS